MRAGAVVFMLASPLTALGCIDRDASALHDPGELAREEIPVDRVSPPSRATPRTVRCGCDADGNLHVAAPPGSKVSRPEDASHHHYSSWSSSSYGYGVRYGPRPYGYGYGYR
jgi:hypothetical protein